MKNDSSELQSSLRNGNLVQVLDVLSSKNQLNDAEFIVLLTENYGIFNRTHQLVNVLSKYRPTLNLLKLIFSDLPSAPQALKFQLPKQLDQFPMISGTTLLHIAAANHLPGRSAVLKDIADQQPHWLTSTDHKDRTPIEYAILNRIPNNFETLLSLYQQPITPLIEPVFASKNPQIIHILLDDPRMLINEHGLMAQQHYDQHREDAARCFFDLQFDARYHLTRAYLNLRQGCDFNAIIHLIEQADKTDHDMVIRDLQRLINTPQRLSLNQQHVTTLKKIQNQLNPPPQSASTNSQQQPEAKKIKSEDDHNPNEQKQQIGQQKKVTFFGLGDSKDQDGKSDKTTKPIDYARFNKYCVLNCFEEMKLYLKRYDNPHTADNHFWVRFAFSLPMMLQSSELLTLDMNDESKQVLYTLYGQDNIDAFVALYKRLVDIDSEAARIIEIADFLKKHNK